jgi:uridine kinase
VKRTELLEKLVTNILGIKHNHPLLVAIDGRDAAGKSVLAKELAFRLRALGATVIESSIDGFHNPSAIRYRKGRESPEGFYRDSFNIAAIKVLLLDPLKTGNLRYKSKVFDYTIDKAILDPFQQAELDSILIFDGIFSLQSELRDYWDYSIVQRLEIRGKKRLDAYMLCVTPRGREYITMNQIQLVTLTLSSITTTQRTL